MREAVRGGSGDIGASGRLRIYALVTVALLAIAGLSFLLVPRGGGAGSCTGYLLDSGRRACLMGVAVSSANASVCGMLAGQYADSCYLQVALASNSSAACAMVSGANGSYACVKAVAVATGDYSLCPGIGEPYASGCTEAVAVKLDMPSLCAAAANATARWRCSSIIGIGRMLRTGDAGYCANVTSAPNESVTGSIIANVTYRFGSAFGNSTAAFGSIAFMPNATYSARDFCYGIAADKLSDAALCSHIANARARAACESRLGVVAGSNATYNFSQLLAGCSGLGAGAQVCVQALETARAIATRNASICGTLGAFGDNCYYSLAAAFNDSGYCAPISNATQRNECLGRAGSG